MFSGSDFSIACAQINPVVGDLRGNKRRILQAARHAKDMQADLLVLPEMVLEGYPVEDWAKSFDFAQTVAAVRDELIAELATQACDLTVIFGSVEAAVPKNYNTLWVVKNGKVLGTKRKACLPQYGVFDEERLFAPGNDPLVLELFSTKLGFVVCEDLWHEQQARQAKKCGAQILIAINASPFESGKRKQRERVVARRSSQEHLPVVYLNCVGAQDELVFDGNSFVMDQDQHTFLRMAGFDEDFAVFKASELFESHPASDEVENVIEELYSALVLATRDYVRKSGFSDVTLGLSGGVDSALVATVAVDALGPEHVFAVGMPTRFTSEESITEAKKLASNLGIDFNIREIDSLFAAFMAFFADDFKDKGWDETEENLQARIRGMILMAYSNKFKRLVLTTGNKSETAVGYSTLYGDTAGAYAVIKDVLKTQVWELCRYVNLKAGFERIPQFIIDRAPSAELREGQIDEASLPPYSVLDAILTDYVNNGLGPDRLVSEGFDQSKVKQVIGLIHRNEFKRRQSPPGPKVSGMAFGRDWRYPIVNRFNPCDYLKDRESLSGKLKQD